MYYLIKEIPCGGGKVCDDCMNNIYISNDFKRIICISCGSVFYKESLEIKSKIEIDYKTSKFIKSFLKLVVFK